MINILVVDGSKTYNNTLCTFLKNPQYKITQAFTLKQAYEALNNIQDIHYIILNISLPDGEADELINNITNNDLNESKIIILSDIKDIQKRNYLFEQGVIDYFSKDVPFPILIQDINSIIYAMRHNKEKNILVIDDSSFVRKSIANILQMKNYNIYTSKDPLEALKLLDTIHMDLIFTDLEMPNMDGIEFLERIKIEEKYRSLPVIVLTGSKSRENYSRVLKHGAIDFIEKPFLTEEILLKTDLHISQSEYMKQIDEQKNTFQTLFNESSDGYSLIKGAAFIDCNNAVLEMLEYKTKTDFLNLKPHQLSPKFQPDGQNSDEKAQKLIQTCLKNGNNRFEWVHIKSSGKEFWVEVVLTKIIINNEIIIHVVWRDIQDKKILVEQIKTRNIKLEKTIKDLKQTQNKLIESEKLASLGELVAGIAHEINTPVGVAMTGITHFIEISKDIKEKYHSQDISQEEFEDYLSSSNDMAEAINTNLTKTADLINSFKQIAVDQTSEEKRNFNLKDYIEEVLHSILHITNKSKLTIQLRCNKDIDINSYPGAFSQIITNLIINSINHAYEENEEGNIYIEIEKQNNRFTLSYKDDGQGISQDDLPKIFDPFFKINQEHKGIGLGLNIIYNIVTANLNGTITCNSTINKGVTFIIKFDV